MGKRKRAMGKRKRRVAAKFQLPEAMIQHIQSFLNAKEAAQTTILSKSWYDAWLTRSNLDFDEKDFKYKPDKFWKFVNKTVQRYEKLNLRINSLRLWVYCSNDTFVNKLIVKAMKMGVTNLDFKSHSAFTLPREVFGSENLIELSVRGCRIFIGVDGEIRCSRLKSLNLDNVYVQLDDVVGKIISSCPLIENLLVSTYPEFGHSNVGLVVDGFRNLKCLTLNYCYIDGVLEISSPSLECINICEYEKFRAKFDVPNIRKFTFSGSGIPKLSFKTTSSTWESRISIERERTPSATWFLELNRLLKALSQSRVSLSLQVTSGKNTVCEGRIPTLVKPEVENLKICGPSSVDPAFFYCLFRCCRPIYITQQWVPVSTGAGKFRPVTEVFVNFVCKRMMHQVILNCCFAYQRTSASCNIEDVSVEFYDESVSTWKPQLLDTSTCLGANEQRIRMHLRWGN